MNNEVVYARALTRFLENRLKDLLMYASWGAQPSAACGSAAGALENVLSFVKENAVPADSIICMHKMETLQKRDAALEQIWKQFADHPINPETEKIEAPFLHLPMSNDDYFVSFDAGTPKEDIWRWFDERHSKGVVYLLYGRPFYEKDPDEVSPLRELVKQEVPFLLSEIFHIPDSELAPHIIEACVDDLCENSNAMFDYDSIYAHIRGTLSQYGITADDMEGKTYDRNR